MSNKLNIGQQNDLELQDFFLSELWGMPTSIWNRHMCTVEINYSIKLFNI